MKLQTGTVILPSMIFVAAVAGYLVVNTATTSATGDGSNGIPPAGRRGMKCIVTE